MIFAARLRDLADRDLAEWPAMPSRSVHVLAPGRGVDVEVVAGVADTATGVPAEPGSRFRIASVTKPFVAAATLRLVEEGRFGLDDPIAGVLGDGSVSLLREGGYDPDAITVRHLLTHTSGIYDFAADAYDASIDGFTKAVYADPRHRWTREEQVRFAMTHGRPYGAPGTVFGYSDTGACLAGEIIERATLSTMGAAIRELVGYERLGLRTTWQETIEPEPADLPPLSHQYEGAWDVGDFDASVDLYGGGGLMSTCRDLARFLRGLFAGQVFRDEATLVAMTTTVDVPLAEGVGGDDDDPRKAAMYLFRAHRGGQDWWGHAGYWGTTAYTCPSLDVTVVACHQRSDMPEGFDRLRILADVLDVLG